MDFALCRVRELVGNSSTKTPDAVLAKSLFSALSVVSNMLPSTEIAVITSHQNLQIFEDVCSSRFISFGKGIQSNLLSIYSHISCVAPGYVIRNIVETMISISNNKVTLVGSREFAVATMGIIMQTRSNDCGKLIEEIIQSIFRVVKGSEYSGKVAGLTALIHILSGCGPRIGDCHPEILRFVGKYSLDRVVEVRVLSAQVIQALIRNSAGCSSVSPDALISASLKGLEDENMHVQDAFVQSYACILFEQFKSYLEMQEKAKIGQARGADTAAPQPRRRITMPKLNLTVPKKVIEDYHVRTVISHVIKCVLKSSGMLRAGYVSVLSRFIRMSLKLVEEDDFEWMIMMTIGMLRDPAIAAMSHEETIYFRIRISQLLNCSVTSQLTETKLLKFANYLMGYISSMEMRTEHELQISLAELNHAIAILGEAASSISDEIQASVTSHLRHSCFGVRSLSAQVLCGLAEVVPGVAADLLRTSLSNAITQSQQLTTFDPSDVLAITSDSDNSEANDYHTTKRKNPKETERLQRMFFFHGHILVISFLLKNEIKLPCGLPSQLSLEVFDFGISLLNQDVFSLPFSVQNVACSIVRAGSLIISSCLNRGYQYSRPRISSLLACCLNLFRVADIRVEEVTGSGSLNTKQTHADELLYELMSVEAALVCVSTLLWSCPDSLEFEPGCLATVIEGLEMGFRVIKNKYQAKFRAHFRFRTLHAILLECFAWLPPGSFPDSCQQLFMEGLRVFRDSISSNFECSCLSEIIDDRFALLNQNSSIVQKNPLYFPLPTQMDMEFLRIENYAVVLNKKENEAFLAYFGKDNLFFDGLRSQFLPGLDWTAPRQPCSHIDSRTIDAAIAVLSTTFGHQSIEFQDKCVTLCTQALAQLTKESSSLSLFSSDEEKRRKERKSYLTCKSVVACLTSIVKNFPFNFFTSPSFNLSWSQTVVDHMLELSTHYCLEIRVAASQTLALLSAKMIRSSLLDTVYSKVSSQLILASEKRGENMIDYCGYLITLSCLFVNAQNRPSLQKNIFISLLDNLRRVDVSLAFRAHGMVALGVVIETIQFNDYELAEAINLLEHICHAAEINFVGISSSEDASLMLNCLLRVVSLAFGRVCLLRETIDDPDLGELQVRFIYLWKLIKDLSKDSILVAESMEFVKFWCTMKLEVPNLDFSMAAAELKLTIENCDTVPVRTLSTAVQGIVALVTRQPKIFLEKSFDSALFNLHNWSVCNVGKFSHLSSSGLDFRCCSQVGYNLGSEVAIQNLTKQIEESIHKISSLVACYDRNIYVIPIVLLCRTIGLSIRSSHELNVGPDNVGEEEDPEISSSSIPQEQPIGEVWTVARHCQWCRDSASQRAYSLNVMGLRTKCIALSVAWNAMDCLGVQGCSIHSDIQSARIKASCDLSELGPSPSETALCAISCFASLFLHDLVNLACACATYTINDKSLISLQLESLRLLESILVLFENSIDPDIQISDQPDSNRKILHQFISQIVSAVRPCLNNLQSPFLSFRSAKIICKLIKGGFIADKVAIKRLVKLFTVQIEIDEKDYHIRPVYRENLSDELSTLYHLFGLAGIAELFFLTSRCCCVREVGDAVSGAILAVIADKIPTLIKLWVAVAVDTTRISQHSFDSTERHVWPVVTAQSDPRRGGLFYSPFFLFGKIKNSFCDCLDVILASTSASILTRTDVQLENLCHLFFVSAAKLNCLDCSMIHLAFVFHQISAVEVKRKENFIPSQEWIRVIVKLRQSLLKTSAISDYQKEQVAYELSSILVNLTFRLKDEYVNFTDVSDSNHLWSSMWESVVSLISFIFPTMLSFDETGLEVVRVPLNSGVDMDRICRFISARWADFSFLSNLLNILRSLSQCGRISVMSTVLEQFCSISILINLASKTCHDENQLLFRHFSSLLSDLKSLNQNAEIAFCRKQLADLTLLTMLYMRGLFGESLLNVLRPCLLHLVLTLDTIATSDWPSLSPIISCLFVSNSLSFCRHFLPSLCAALQVATVLSTDRIVEWLTPALLALLRENDSIGEFIETLIEAVHLCFNRISPSYQAEYASILLPSLCENISGRSQNPRVAILIGNFVTEVAVSFPDSIRESIASFTPSDRSILQTLMRQALQQSDKKVQAAAVQSAPSNLKRIDLSKYRVS